MSLINVVIGAAGHIDHGKTSLIKALTGTDCDRLLEEKKRGITIDIGFAKISLGQDKYAGVVDVPGHQRFVKNMLAGAAGIDMALFVISADDSVMPQSVEHMAILEMLGIEKGVVALTKTDLVDQETLELAMMEVSEFIQASPLAGAKIIPCSAVTGQGIEEIRTQIASVASSIKERRPGGYFRMAVDRAFNMKGHGLVVTGTVISGSVCPEDHLLLSPGGAQVRVRRVQSHGETVQKATAGARTALNISGVHKDSVSRGMILCHPAIMAPCGQLTARVVCHKSSPLKIVHGKSYFFHIHAAQALCKIILSGAKSLAPGRQGVARIIFEDDKIQINHADRFVIRSSAADQTIGGGFVLEPGGKAMGSKGLKATAKKWEALATRQRGIPAILDERPWGFPEQDICAMFNIPPDQIGNMTGGRDNEYGRFSSKGASYIFRDSERDRIFQRLAEEASSFHQKNPSASAMEENTLARAALPHMEQDLAGHWIKEAVLAKKLEAVSGGVRVPGTHAVFSDKEKKLQEQILALYRNAGLTSPPKTDHIHKTLGIKPAEAARMVRTLFQSGELVSLAPDYTLSKDALERARAILIKELESAGSVETGRFRDLLGVGRKAAIDILEHFDNTGLTRRVENKRILKDGGQG